MRVDLRCHGWFRRQSMLFTDDDLVVLEHESGQDRLRRFKYDRIESLIVWRQVPWGVVITAIVASAGALLLMMFGQNTAVMATGLMALVAFMGLLARAVYCRRTYIQLRRGGRAYLYTTITSPGRIRTFCETLLGNAGYYVPPPTPAPATGTAGAPDETGQADEAVQG